ncbi:MAG: PD40 domain-containing protein [Sphingobacteriaceae bacterium]|nr:PD40 domain-containing protein [Cytophagaceae bacterium]
MKTAFLLGTWAFALAGYAQVPKNVVSIVEIVDVASGKRRVIYEETRHLEAPNWTRDGKSLLVNSNGKLYTLPPAGGTLTEIPLAGNLRCNNDHLLSFDGKTLFISASEPGQQSAIFTVSASGGTPQRLTPQTPSYLHGVSPDGKTLAFCAERAGAWDVYTIPAAGGPETRLTDAQGLDDGPEYSYDGRWIYFNSNRTGQMHLYRMRADGSTQEQLTNDSLDNWFGHPSPDGKSLVFISYLQDQKGAHPFGKDVKLRVMDLKTRKIQDLTEVFFGGQGTINVPSWSPDGKQVAFVRYKVE